MSQAETACGIYPALEPRFEPRLRNKGTRRGGAGVRQRATATVPTVERSSVPKKKFGLSMSICLHDLITK
jgi:hypothetical protein